MAPESTKDPVTFAFAAKVRSALSVPLIIPRKVLVPLFPWVKVLRKLPRLTLLAKLRLAVLLASDTTVESSPNWTLPPMEMPPPNRVLSNARFPFEANVPPLRFSTLAEPLPKPVVPRAITVPELIVKDWAFVVEEYVPVPKTPEPLMMKPVPAVVEIAWPLKSKVEPEPKLIVRTAPLVPKVDPIPAKFTLTLFETVTLPTLVAAPIPANE